MTTLYSNNFDSETAGTLPTGWTAVSGTWTVGTVAPVSGTQSLSGGTTSAAVVLYTGAGFLQTDQSTSVDFIYAAGSVRCHPAPMVRVSSTSLTTGYVVLLAGTNDVNLGIFRVAAGSYTSLVSTAHGQTLTAGTAYTIELRAVGTTIEARIYPSGGTRPTSAQATVVNAAGAAGAPGIYNQPNTATSPGGYDNFVWTDSVVAAATSYTLTGPTSGLVGTASSNFTVAANGAITGSVVITPSDSSGGGTFTPTSITFTSGTTSGTFTYTASSAGAKTISTTNNGGLTDPSSIGYTAAAVATAVTLTGPTSGNTGVPSTNFTVGANGTLTAPVTVTPNDSSAGGTFTPTSVIISSGSPTATFTYTPASSGAKVIGVTNNGLLSNPSTITYTATTVSATATTLTGPTSGVVGTASTNFTVGANGTITGTVVITPSDSGGGGTFTPTTVSITSASPTGTFTYTPASSGAKSISTTNNGSLSNPSAITYTVSSSTMIAVTDSNLYWSAYNWDSLAVGDFGVSIASKQTTCCGAYVKFSFTGTTSISIMLDSTTLAGFAAGSAPLIMWSRSGLGMQQAQLTIGSSSLTLATGLTAATTYTMEIYLLGTDAAAGDRWGSVGNLASNSPTNIFRIQGFAVDSGTTTAAYPFLRAKTSVEFGDSITEGLHAAGTLTQPADHAQSSSWFSGPGMGAEYSVIGYGSQGWNQVGSGNVPIFPSTWNFYSAGRPKTFSNVDYVFVMHGYNGSFSAAVVTAWITSARAAFGASTWIFVVTNPGGKGTVNNTTGVNNYLSANPSDTKVALLDLATSIETRFYNGSTGQATEYSIDSIHPNVVGNASIASVKVAKAQALINAGASTGGNILAIGLGGLGLTASGQLVAVI